MQENTEQKNSEYGHFSHSVFLCFFNDPPKISPYVHVLIESFVFAATYFFEPAFFVSADNMGLIFYKLIENLYKTFHALAGKKEPIMSLSLVYPSITQSQN